MKTASMLMMSALALAPVAALSDERPPADAKSMHAVIVKLEEAKYGPITDVSFDDGQWEVEAVRDGVNLELNISPITGDIVSEHPDEDDDARPPKGTAPLSKILTALTDAGWAPVVEASFEGRMWEVEAYQGDAKHELHIDATTGKVVRDRADD